MKTVLVVGRGQIGTALTENLRLSHSVVWWDKDLQHINDAILGEYSVDAVVNTAGKTDLTWCEDNAREAFRCNVEGPASLLRVCQQAKVPLIHFSSGCIWDGPYNDGREFVPSDPPSPASYYAWTKAACDAFLLQHGRVGLNILRPRQVFSAQNSPRNTLVKLLRYDRLINTPNSMTSMETILKTTRFLLDNPVWSGVWNVYDKGVSSPFAVGLMLAKAGLRNEPTELTKKELDSWHRPKRVDTVLYDAQFEECISPRPLATTLGDTIYELATLPAFSVR